MFLSYAHKDVEVVAKLNEALQDTPGLTTWFDAAEMDSFDNIPRRLEQGLDDAHLVVACLSRTYVTRPACMWEVTELLGRIGQDDPKRRLLVVEVEPGAREDEAVVHLIGEELLVESMPGLDNPAALGSLVEKIRTRALDMSDRVGSLKARNPVWYPSDPMGARSFRGRFVEMLKLHAQLTGRWLHENDPGHRAPAWVIGMGGAGKTLLVERYAARFGRCYPGGVVRIRVGGEASGGTVDTDGTVELLNRYELELRRLAEIWGMELPAAQPPTGLTLEQSLLPRITAIREALRSWEGWNRGRVLWMLDDMPGGLSRQFQGEALRLLSCPHPTGVTVVTTRAHEYAALGEGEHIELDMLDEETALAVLSSHYTQHSAEDEQALREIHATLGGHPLATDVTGMRLRSGTMSPAQVVQDLRDDLSA